MRYTGRTDFVPLIVQEKAAGVLAERMAEHRSTYQTQLDNTSVGSSQLAGLIELSDYEAEAQYRTVKSRVEQCQNIKLTMDHNWRHGRSFTLDG